MLRSLSLSLSLRNTNIEKRIPREFTRFALFVSPPPTLDEIHFELFDKYVISDFPGDIHSLFIRPFGIIFASIVARMKDDTCDGVASACGLFAVSSRLPSGGTTIAWARRSDSNIATHMKHTAQPYTWLSPYSQRNASHSDV